MAKTKDTSTKDKQKKSKGYIRAIECSIIMLFFGVAAILLSVFFFSKELVNNPALEPVNTYCFFIGMGLCAIAVIVFISAISSANKQRRNKQVKPVDGGVDFDSSKVTYIPSQEAPTFIEMGGRQTIEEKFNQIAKMDKTQFVIYVARLFSRKGYQVKLTPVFDNFGIDMLVQKTGGIIAVSCVLSNKILGATDVQPVLEGATHYPASGSMVLTNMYFDRTAVDFAKTNKISLVDRVILTEDFMN